VLVDAKYEERIRIKHLSMEPSLQGAKVQFDIEHHRIEITLPMLPLEEKGKPGDRYAEAEADVWNNNGEIINVHIYFLSVAVLGLQFDLPVAAAQLPHRNVSLYTSEETAALDKRCSELNSLGRRAIDFFLRVARWKTKFGLMDLDTRPDNATFFGGRLFNESHGGAFAPLTNVVTLPKRHRLKPSEWKDIEETLAAGMQPPVWNEFLASAQRRIDMNDLRAGTIDLAISAESIIRQFPGLSMRMRKRARISELLKDWTKLGFPAVSHLPWFAKLGALFKVRNNIMHDGDGQAIQISFCRDSVISVEHLIATLAA
jgi:hypothetical protein